MLEELLWIKSLFDIKEDLLKAFKTRDADKPKNILYSFTFSQINPPKHKVFMQIVQNFLEEIIFEELIEVKWNLYIYFKIGDRIPAIDEIIIYDEVLTETRPEEFGIWDDWPVFGRHSYSVSLGYSKKKGG
jgi:hypothetical protein